jgi:hypothetical protein
LKDINFEDLLLKSHSIGPPLKRDHNVRERRKTRPMNLMKRGYNTAMNNAVVEPMYEEVKQHSGLDLNQLRFNSVVTKLLKKPKT